MAEVTRWLGRGLGLGRSVVAISVGSVRANAGIGLLALGIALALWLFVTEEANPRITVDVSPAIRLRMVNVPDGMATLGAGEPVTIRASAPRNVAEKLNATDFQATADLAGLSLGVHQVSVRVEHSGNGGGVRVEEILPGRVSITMETLRSVIVPVRLNVQQRPPVGHEVTESSVSITPLTVTVSGPEDLVIRVTEAVADLDLSRANDGLLETNVTLAATNGSGTVIDGVTITPASARIGVQVKQTLFARAFVVAPRTKNAPEAGYVMASIEVQPNTVVVQGMLEGLDKLEAVSTDEIDLAGAVSDITQTVRLSLPQGITMQSPLQSFQVRIRITPTVGRAIFLVPPTFEGLASVLTATSSTSSVEIEIEGPTPQLRTLLPSQLRAVANLVGLGVGRYDVPVTARLPDGLRAIAVRPGQIPVEVARQ